jgi:hypothetical protein
MWSAEYYETTQGGLAPEPESVAPPSAVINIDMERICPECPSAATLSTGAVIFTADDPAVLEIIDYINTYQSKGNMSDDLFTYLQGIHGTWAPRDANNMLDWILSLQETHINALVDVVPRIYDATINKQGASVKINGRSWCAEREDISEHAPDAIAFRDHTYELSEGPLFTTESWFKNICKNGNECFRVGINATSLRLGNFGYVAVNARDEYLDGGFSCREWGFYSTALDQCWRKRTEGIWVRAVKN